MKNLVSLLLFLMGATVSYASVVPTSLISGSTILTGLTGGTSGTAGNFYAHVIDGQTAYVDFQKSYITKIQNINGTQTSSILVTPTAWASAGNVSQLTAFYGFGISGNYLVWTDTLTDAIWKADKTTGAISNVVTKAQIQGYLGTSASDSSGSFTIAPNGGLTFFESKSQKFLNVGLSGNLTTVVSVGGSATAGATYDSTGRLYWGASGNIYRYAAGGTIETVLTSADIIAKTSATGAGLNDIFFGNDGNIYFYDQTANGILSFNPNAPSTLTVLLPSSGRAQTFGWYNNGSQDYLTYHAYTGDLMGIAIPEPVTMLLLGLGGLTLIRRR